jgi:hypothetical protein
MWIRFAAHIVRAAKSTGAQASAQSRAACVVEESTPTRDGVDSETELQHEVEEQRRSAPEESNRREQKNDEDGKKHRKDLRRETGVRQRQRQRRRPFHALSTLSIRHRR